VARHKRCPERHTIALCIGPGRGAIAMPKMTVTTNDGRFVADFETGEVDPMDYQPEIDQVLREAFE
jgi:hypothetical protein